MGTDAARATAGGQPTVADLLVPPLVAGLTDDDPATVRSAGHAVAVLVAEVPAVTRPLAGALVDRLAGDPATPLVRALATVATDEEATVREALLAGYGREDARRFYDAVQTAEPWHPPDRNFVLGGDLVTACRRTVTADGPRATGGVTAGGEDETAGAVAPVDAASKRAARIERAAASRVFTDIVTQTEFEEVSVVAPESERRYANVLRTRASAADETFSVGVRLFHRPEEHAGFADELDERVAAWGAVSNAEGLVAVADHGTAPRPWAVTEYVEDTLARRRQLSAAETLRHARVLSGALATLHEAGIVHGGLDPRNVVYPADTLADGGPMLDNVGLLATYRQAFDPVDYLNPRYAAPEYFDSQYGELDEATDVYGLGMVLYRAATGHPPFQGTFEDIRVQVLNDHPPAPSTVSDGLPETFDEILARATAKQKLTRYESAERLHRDLERVSTTVE